MVLITSAVTYVTQRNGPLLAREKFFCENPLDAKRISFGIKYIALEPKKYIVIFFYIASLFRPYYVL